MSYKIEVGNNKRKKNNFQRNVFIGTTLAVCATGLCTIEIIGTQDPEVQQVHSIIQTSPMPTVMPSSLLVKEVELERVESKMVMQPPSTRTSTVISRGNVIRQMSAIHRIVIDEAEYIGLDISNACTLIDTESGFANISNNNNNSSTDFGPAQINNRGAVLSDFMGKTVTLSNGSKITVDNANYKTNLRLNVHMGIKTFKDYLQLCNNNPYIAYAMYNGGPGMLDLFTYDKDSDAGTVMWILNNCKNRNLRAGAKQVARNLKNNFNIKYNKWKKG